MRLHDAETAQIKERMARNKATRKVPPSKTTVEVFSAGQDLTVSLARSNVKLTIRPDGLGQPTILGVGIGEMRPMTFKRSGGFDVLLSMHYFGDTFNFLGLPRYVRDKIYSMVFHASPYMPFHMNVEEDTRIRTENFHLKRPIEPLRFLAHLSKSATGGGGISFVNHQILRETTGLLIRSKHYHVCGDTQAYALLKSMSTKCNNKWPGPLTLHLNNWETADLAEHWIPLLDSPPLEVLKVRYINIITGSQGWKLGQSSNIEKTPIGQLAALGYSKLIGFWLAFDPPLFSNAEDDRYVVRQLEYGMNGRRLFPDRNYLDMGGPVLLAKKLYERMEHTTKSKQIKDALRKFFAKGGIALLRTPPRTLESPAKPTDA